MHLTVIGTGYVGAVHAACMADIGHDVLGVDIDAERIAALTSGRPPFYEPGLSEMLMKAVDTGRLRFTTSLTEAAWFGDTHFICVGTPQSSASGAADLRHVEAAVDGLAPYLKDDLYERALVVGKSTVPVGTADRLTERLHAAAPHAELAWNPEFLREGCAVRDTLRPERIVVGARSEQAEARLRELYAPLLDAGTPFIGTDPATAELVKLASNSFLATKISFINAMAEICDATGADVLTLAEAMGRDSRIGPRFLAPGLGFGGSCLPKDIRAFTARAEEFGLGDSVAFLRQVDEINTRQRLRTVDLAQRLVGGSFPDRSVAVLGAAFKPHSDDVRDSPALAVADEIRRRGARVRVHDPEAVDNARAAHPALQFALDVAKACEQADLVLHLTEWPQYRELDPAALATVVRTPAIVDARNTLDPAAWRSAGWTLRALGRPRLD
ncbi:UDP-glucose dehydrogenase family protein [Streptomyces neyagawaensis]|uniref:UDP-glucose dehydrogenase family protein n=1 Tax=Streptomyces neyagawaensis TaxID=42238 RepID=UPI0007C68C8A|nr:UDP-glucose/GDP-mannose dehydrogenase family protein [Streptomyces neyagawaensis]MCL6738335.1 UDP-glucose/GDP-mannose dehydrogenase family protein [Streptomyces neyagawaensis]MDE1688156.1 UDP-glucose/GDP-mannose dehydrogenase family protein [Streptomyces neyagawaensis]